MQHSDLFSYYGYPVRLQDGSVNPVAVEADRLLQLQYPRGLNLGVMTGTALASAWANARKTLKETSNSA